MDINKAFVPLREKGSEHWEVIDATDRCVGRLATEIVTKARGKVGPRGVFFSPFVNTGYRLVVINADKVRFTGDKMEDKIYRFYTGYVGNDREMVAKSMAQRKPAFILEHAVKGMLRKNKLERSFWKKNIFIYSGSTHPHGAQCSIKSN